MNFQLRTSQGFISLAIVLLLAGVVWAGVRRQNTPTLRNSNANTPTVQTLGTNGVTFTSPVGLNWVDAGSTAGNYSNLILNAAEAENVSSIEVGIPLKETGGNYTFVDEVKSFSDISGIHPSILQGHTGEAITYWMDTRSRKDDIPWVGMVTKEQYPSRYLTSPVRLTYSHGDGNDVLDAVWEQVRSSLKW